MSLYGCHNKPRPTVNSTYLGRVGYEDAINQNWGTFSREPIYIDIKSAFGTTDCQYTLSHASDPLCSGCMHQAKEAS